MSTAALACSKSGKARRRFGAFFRFRGVACGMSNGLLVRYAQHAAHSVYTEWVFEWDPRKAEANAAKHGVSFDDAETVFLNPEALDGPDLQHSSEEARCRRLGRSAAGAC